MSNSRKVWIEIRRGPNATAEMGKSRFTVVKVTDPRGPGEPTDFLDPRRGARGYTGADTFEKACDLAAQYATEIDPKVQRAKASFELAVSVRRNFHREQFLAAGEPE